MEICCKFTTFFRKIAVFLQSNCIFSIVKDKVIYSQEWCDMLFADRNRAYGAYVLRRDIGRRYALVLKIFLCIFAAFMLLLAAVAYYMYGQVQEAIAELNELTQMERLKPLEGHEFKQVAQGRRVVGRQQTGTQTAPPEIVDGVVLPLDFGVEGLEEIKLENDDLLLRDADSLHARQSADMPDEGLSLTPTEVVEEMPKFPGGIGALMKWLDTHIIYTPASVRAKVEGDMELAFVVDRDGTVRDPRVTKSLNPSLDKNALMALRQMPRWEPARSRGKVTQVQIKLPIHFQLK